MLDPKTKVWWCKKASLPRDSSVASSRGPSQENLAAASGKVQKISTVVRSALAALPLTCFKELVVVLEELVVLVVPVDVVVALAFRG